MKRIAEHAKANGLDVETTEGAGHTKVKVGEKRTTVPRHNEINEITAKGILKQIGAIE